MKELGQGMAVAGKHMETYHMLRDISTAYCITQSLLPA